MNTPGRTIVVGDIHGCYDELAALLDKLSFDANDRIVAVGDLIVKGERNREVLELFIRDARFSSVLGNHDRALLRYWRGETETLKKSQEACRAELASDWRRYADFLESLPGVINLDSHIVVHAGVRPGVPLAEQSLDDLTELRTLGDDRTNREGTPWYEVYDDTPTVLFGHWPAPVGTRCTKRALGLDTGCVYGYELTAYIIETGKTESINALRAYDAPPARLV